MKCRCRDPHWAKCNCVSAVQDLSDVLQVKDIIVKGKGDQQQAVGVRLADGRVFRGKAIVSNATRWDTFEKLLAHEEMPKSESLFRSADCVTPLHAWHLSMAP